MCEYCMHIYEYVFVQVLYYTRSARGVRITLSYVVTRVLAVMVRCGMNLLCVCTYILYVYIFIAGGEIDWFINTLNIFFMAV